MKQELVLVSVDVVPIFFLLLLDYGYILSMLAQKKVLLFVGFLVTLHALNQGNKRLLFSLKIKCID